MKFNWGTGILIVIILFVATMVGIIIFSMNQQVNLVSPDYYPKGVNHEIQLQKKRNLNSLKEKVSYEKSGDVLILSFPKLFGGKKLEGTVQFYFITNYQKDITLELGLNDSLQQSIQLNQFEKGRYIVKIDWSDGEKEYYQEIDFSLR